MKALWLLLLAMPLALCGVLKIGYDLALWAAFRRHSGHER